ncbi:MAG: AraC family transcriptional regulator [Thermoguttaceae bacterium]|nr:AraC family transcriptional regulator [Thermoguttaceae bacterium]
MNKSSFYTYLPVGERELDWGLYMTTCGYHEIPPRVVFPKEDHPSVYQFDPAIGRILPEYQLIWFVQGQGTFISEPTGTIPLKPGSVLLLFPDVWHSYRPDPTTGWTDYWVGFNGSYIFEMCRRGNFSPSVPVFPIKNPIQITGLFEEIVENVRSNPGTRAFHYSADILKILTHCAANLDQPKSHEVSGKEQIFQEALRLIWGWSYRTLTIDILAESVHINRRTLERYFREMNGRSILEEIHHCRVVRAQRLLENTRLPIGRIALMVGFSSPDQMRRVFRETQHSSPEHYRRIHQ